MISEEEACSRLLQTIRLLPSRRVNVADAGNCFAAEDLFARIPLPVFDNSAMDGYAVVASSSAHGSRLRVIGEQPAGLDRRLRVSAGEAVRIFTGAPIPVGADAVIMQEDVTRNGGEIVVKTTVAPGEFIRRQGCDLAKGQKILAKGGRIRATTVALLASQGLLEIAVGGEVEAAIISTGDELIGPGESIEPGQIYDSNSALLRALLEGTGARVASVEHCRDKPEPLRDAMRRGRSHPLLILTGGVSVGEHDLVRTTLQSLGGEIDVWRVAIKPGKPFLFGRLGGCALFGLPGNPVSAFATFLAFVRPAILKMMGASTAELTLPTFDATLAADVKNEGDRAHYIRGRLKDGTFAPIGRQESHALFGLSQANSILRLAPSSHVKAGSVIKVQIWDL
jgi:molybdopterin molybdotransferase